MGPIDETPVETDRTAPVGAATIAQLRLRAESLRATAALLDPITAAAFERRADQLDRGVGLVQAVLDRDARIDAA